MSGVDYLLAAHIQVTGGTEAAMQLNQVVTQINNFGAAARNSSTGQMASDMDKASQSGSSLATTLGKIGDAAIRMGTYMSLQAIWQGFKDGADAVLDFNDAMTQSLAIQTGVTTGMRSQMESMAESLAFKFGEGPEEVAKGFYYLASAGLSVQQQLATLPQVAAFAKAGMMDLDSATEMLFDSLSAIGQRSDDPVKLAANLGHLGDVLTKAAIDSMATVEQMGAALSNKAGSSIKAFNLDLEESVGVLEVFANQGIKGVTAGERFSMLIRDMALKSQKFGEEWKAMGVQVFDSNGQFNSLITIFQQLDAALLPLSGQERIAKLKEMGFTLRDISTVMSILGTSGSLASFVAQLDEAGGIAERVAKNQMESLRAKLQQLSAAFKIGAIEGFEKLVEFGDWLVGTFAPAADAAGPTIAKIGQGLSIVGGEFLRMGTAAAGGALQGIATAMESIGQVASTNSGAVETFAYALASLAGIKATSEIVSLGAAIGANLIGRLSEATQLLQVVAIESAAAFSASGGGMKGAAMAANTALTGTLELLSSIPVAGIAVAGLALGLGVVWKAHADNVREARQAVEELVQAIASELGVSVDEAAAAFQRFRNDVDGGTQSFDKMTAAVRQAMSEQVSGRVVSEGLADAFGHLGITASQVGTALTTGTDFFEGWKQDTHTIAEMRAQLDQLPPSVRPVAEALLNARESGSITYQEFFRLASAFDFVADAADHTTQKFQDYAREQLGTALANGEIDSAFLKTFGIMEIGKANAEQLYGAMQLLQQIKAPITPGWDAVDASFLAPQRQAIEEVGNAADDAAQEIKDFQDALSELARGASEMGKLADLSQGMNDLWEAGHKYAMEQGPLADAFTSHTKEANALQRQLSDTARAHVEWASGLADQGNLEGAKQHLYDYRTELYNMFIGLGMSREQILPLLETLHLTDAEIEGLDGKKAKVEVTDDGTADATKTAIDGAANPEGQAREAEIKAKAIGLVEADAEFNTLANGGSTGRQAPISPFVMPDAMADSEVNLNTTARKRDSEAHQYDTNTAGVEGSFNQSARDRNSTATQNPAGQGNVETQFNQSGRDRNSGATQVPYVNNAESWLNYTARDRTSTVTVYTTSGNVYAGPTGFGIAEGGIVHAYAEGGFENHVAQIGRMGASRIWNEPETGGEAYIPLAMAKRDRSMAIWEEAGRMMGVKNPGGGQMVNIHAPIDVKVSGADNPEATAQAVSGQVAAGVEAGLRRVLVELKSR